MNLINIVGKNTQEYINQLHKTENKKMKKLELPKTETVETVETVGTVETVCHIGTIL